MIYQLTAAILMPFTMFIIKSISGLDNVPKKGAFILASNHCSYLDVIIPVIFAKYFKRKVHYLGKEKLFESWLGNKFYTACGLILLDREKGVKTALKTALKSLKEGNVIGIFPEGGRSRDGRLQRGKTGVARLALAARVPVVPVGLIGTFDLMPPGRVIPKFKKKVKMNFGKPLHFDKYYGKKNKVIFRKATTTVMEKIAELSKQKYFN